MSRAMRLPARVAAALLAVAGCANAQDTHDAAPEGSAAYTLDVVGDDWAAAQSALAGAHERLLAALDGNADRPSRLARAVRLQHERWLAYRNADCTLTGILTGAGGDWPTVHGMTCKVEHATRRINTLDAATRCLRALAPEAPNFERRGCLQALVDRDGQSR